MHEASQVAVALAKGPRRSTCATASQATSHARLYTMADIDRLYTMADIETAVQVIALSMQCHGALIHAFI